MYGGIMGDLCLGKKFKHLDWTFWNFVKTLRLLLGDVKDSAGEVSPELKEISVSEMQAGLWIACKQMVFKLVNVGETLWESE